MSLYRFSYPLTWPGMFSSVNGEMGSNAAVLTYGTAQVIDAVGEKVSAGGHVIWEDGGTHTVGTSSVIKFRTGAVTWATAGSTIRAGLQDFAGDGSGNTYQTPDGTFDVYKDIVVGDGTMTSASDNTEVSFTLTNGSKSVAHLQEVAVVFDMTTRNGSDSVGFTGISTGNSFRPGQMLFTTSWGTSSGLSPNILLIADDGTRGVFMGGSWVPSQAQHDYQLSSNPDEYGVIFTAPFTGMLAGFRAVLAANSANAEMVAALFSDPLGTPVSLVSKTFYGEEFNGSTTERGMVFMFNSAVRIVKGTRYALGLRSTGTANINLVYIEYSTTADKGPLVSLEFSKCSREGGSGAFTEVTAHVPGIQLFFESIDVATGGTQLSLGI